MNSPRHSPDYNDTSNCASVSELCLASDGALGTAVPLILELRPELTEPDAIAFLREAADQGYRVLCCRIPGDPGPAALAGFRILMTSRGRIVALEDLVVAQERRRHHLASLLLEHLRALGRSADCERIELDTARSNHDAQKFYIAQGFEAGAFHFAVSM
jgi:ribosomal protein S18 acetylase RimI-like enzyme